MNVNEVDCLLYHPFFSQNMFGQRSGVVLFCFCMIRIQPFFLQIWSFVCVNLLLLLGLVPHRVPGTCSLSQETQDTKRGSTCVPNTGYNYIHSHTLSYTTHNLDILTTPVFRLEEKTRVPRGNPWGTKRTWKSHTLREEAGINHHFFFQSWDKLLSCCTSYYSAYSYKCNEWHISLCIK